MCSRLRSVQASCVKIAGELECITWRKCSEVIYTRQGYGGEVMRGDSAFAYEPSLLNLRVHLQGNATLDMTASPEI